MTSEVVHSGRENAKRSIIKALDLVKKLLEYWANIKPVAILRLHPVR